MKNIFVIQFYSVFFLLRDFSYFHKLVWK